MPTLVFRTKRLNVFKVELDPELEPTSCMRQIYLAFERDTGIGRPVVTATVCEAMERCKGGPFVEYVETCDGSRGDGFARELWEGLSDYYERPLKAEAATKEGCHFLVRVGVLKPEACNKFSHE